MTIWQNVRRQARAATAVARCRGPQPEPDQLAERYVAAGVGLLVLVGAIGTYFAVVGRIDPHGTDPPQGRPPPTATTPGPVPTPTVSAEID